MSLLLQMATTHRAEETKGKEWDYQNLRARGKTSAVLVSLRRYNEAASGSSESRWTLSMPDEVSLPR